jgi:hypothetical protein
LPGRMHTLASSMGSGQFGDAHQIRANLIGAASNPRYVTPPLKEILDENKASRSHKLDVGEHLESFPRTRLREVTWSKRLE